MLTWISFSVIGSQVSMARDSELQAGSSVTTPNEISFPSSWLSVRGLQPEIGIDSGACNANELLNPTPQTETT